MRVGESVVDTTMQTLKQKGGEGKRGVGVGAAEEEGRSKVFALR